MLQRRRVLGVAVIVFALASVALADQPNMRAARTNLQQARAQLQAATNNKAGHRVKAIEYVNQAIGYVNNGIAFDRRNNHPARDLFAAAVVPDQPHMERALSLLREAKNNLEHATSDKGGWRQKAIGAVNDAIDETKKGIDAGE